jgi:hypothetical protein
LGSSQPEAVLIAQSGRCVRWAICILGLLRYHGALALGCFGSRRASRLHVLALIVKDTPEEANFSTGQPTRKKPAKVQ